MVLGLSLIHILTGQFVDISGTSDYVDFVIEIADIVIAEFL